MPSFNEITGARISSGVHVKGTDEEKFRSNWDLIFGNKPNAKTLAAIEELDNGQGEHFDSVESLMADLEDSNCMYCGGINCDRDCVMMNRDE